MLDDLGLVVNRGSVHEGGVAALNEDTFERCNNSEPWLALAEGQCG